MFSVTRYVLAAWPVSVLGTCGSGISCPKGSVRNEGTRCLCSLCESVRGEVTRCLCSLWESECRSNGRCVCSSRASELVMRVDAVLSAAPKTEARKEVNFPKDNHR